MKREYLLTTECGGEKARRLYWATRKRGIVKVSNDGGMVWIFEKVPPTLRRDGFIINASEFLARAAEILRILPEDVFSLEDCQIREVARTIAGVTPKASTAASEADDEEK